MVFIQKLIDQGVPNNSNRGFLLYICFTCNSNFMTWDLYPWHHHLMWTFSALLAICARDSTVTGEFPCTKGQWHRPLMFSLICAWINGWVNNCDTGDLRCHHTHYDVTVMTVNLGISRITKLNPEHGSFLYMFSGILQGFKVSHQFQLLRFYHVSQDLTGQIQWCHLISGWVSCTMYHVPCINAEVWFLMWDVSRIGMQPIQDTSLIKNQTSAIFFFLEKTFDVTLCLVVW